MSSFRNDLLNVNIIYKDGSFKELAFSTNDIKPQEAFLKLKNNNEIKDFCLYGFANYYGYVDGGKKINKGDIILISNWKDENSANWWVTRNIKDKIYEEKNTQGNINGNTETTMDKQFSSTTACA